MVQGINALLLQDLRTLLGTTYGAYGQLPNLVNRFAGYSATPGASAGSADATLVSHNHGSGSLGGSTSSRSLTGSFRPGTHSQINATGVFSDAGNVGSVEGHDAYNGRQINFNATHDHSLNISGSTGNRGVSATNANLPPYLGMRPIIKY